jgi:hypothetical protein
MGPDPHYQRSQCKSCDLVTCDDVYKDQTLLVKIELDHGPVWHNLFYSFFTEINNNCTKQQTSAHLISSTTSQDELKAEHKNKLLFNSFSENMFVSTNISFPKQDRSAQKGS